MAICLGLFITGCFIAAFSLLYWKHRSLQTKQPSNGLTILYFALLSVANIPLILSGFIPILFNDSGTPFGWLTVHFWKAFGWSMACVTPVYLAGFLAGFRLRPFAKKTFLLLYSIVALCFCFLYAFA